ncbi:MAG: DnaD domain protein [Lachnospiraceae bacterium]|nr:DnaD domain protein [Lachnospiraceae bacterium]
MHTLKITSENNESYTTVSNLFIDEYMAKAQGDYVKIYLYLLRLMQADRQVSVSDIADFFDITEKDLCRALKYWIKEEMLRLVYDGKMLSGITLLAIKPHEQPETINDPFATMAQFQSEQDAKKRAGKRQTSRQADTPPVPLAVITGNTMSQELSAADRDTLSRELSTVDRDTLSRELSTVDRDTLSRELTAVNMNTLPQKPNLTAQDLKKLADDEAFSQLLYLLETYLGKNITASESRSLAYIYDDLEFNTDLLEYLIEFCVMNNKKSVRYIEKVAIDWYQQGITDVETAREATKQYLTKYTSVLKALGITRRSATNIEINYIDTWYKQMGFDSPIILEACKRALIQKPSSANFPYVNGILESWHKANVHTLSDINELDQNFYNSRKKTVRVSASVKASMQDKKAQSARSDKELDELSQLFMEDVSHEIS